MLKIDDDGSVFAIDPEGITQLLPRVRTRFNYDAQHLSKATAQVNDKPSMTKQSFAEDADINTIVRRFGLTGELPDNARSPEYTDFEGVFDFQSAMNAVLRAEEMFMDFPAETRKEFDNDPQKMMMFVNDEANRERAIELGLIAKPKAAPEPVFVRVVPEPDKSA